MSSSWSRVASARPSARRSRACSRRRLRRCSCAEVPVSQATPAVDLGALRPIFDLAGVGMLLLTPDGMFRLVNKAFCEMTGYTRAELEGRSYQGMVRMDDMPADEHELRRVREGHEPPARYDTRFVRKDGSEMWVRAHSSLIRDAADAPLYIVAAVIDMTDSRETQEELQRHLHFTR